MAQAATFSRSLRLFVDRNLSPDALRAEMARRAIAARDDLIARGEAPPSWRRYVDGKADAPETSVRLDGAILYRFNLTSEAAEAALALCRSTSPVRSGRFRDAWVLICDGKPWKKPLKDLPADGTILIVNPMPYARKIETGALEPRIRRNQIERVRQTLMRRCPTLSFGKIFVRLSSGIASSAPYILRGASGERRTRAGTIMTYPALQITLRS
ncbi:hypothetical protein ACFFGF_09920 [Asaia lannensis]|uniref:Uncharacterized protein n=1 Tax=Asaia lannensis NBRC 102526 TaxID=1307926 RepID=A0ABT1CL91_9PROT|nr:hypothetical protein [Asaia lannensis]MCO6161034.1 hypothetical protein [Asaia lannensis NBRC 102526]GBQ95477.1 hypothetical protein AA102526_0441 [Asaia lannensis NBRC 102526]